MASTRYLLLPVCLPVSDCLSFSLSIIQSTCYIPRFDWPWYCFDYTMSHIYVSVCLCFVCLFSSRSVCLFAYLSFRLSACTVTCISWEVGRWSRPEWGTSSSSSSPGRSSGHRSRSYRRHFHPRVRVLRYYTTSGTRIRSWYCSTRRTRPRYASESWTCQSSSIPLAAKHLCQRAGI